MESIKWGQPVFEHFGPFAYLRPAARHVTFGFWRGGELKDPTGVLEGTGNRMRHVKLIAPNSVAPAVLAAFVREAVTLNDQQGDPTRTRR